MTVVVAFALEPYYPGRCEAPGHVPEARRGGTRDDRARGSGGWDRTHHIHPPCGSRDGGIDSRRAATTATTAEGDRVRSTRRRARRYPPAEQVTVVLDLDGEIAADDHDVTVVETDGDGKVVKAFGFDEVWTSPSDRYGLERDYVVAQQRRAKETAATSAYLRARSRLPRPAVRLRRVARAPRRRAAPVSAASSHSSASSGDSDGGDPEPDSASRHPRVTPHHRPGILAEVRACRPGAAPLSREHRPARHPGVSGGAPSTENTNAPEGFPSEAFSLGGNRAIYNGSNSHADPN